MLEEPEELSWLELPGEELLEEPLELPRPLLPSEPPIPEVGLTPKYENTLCFHPGCDKSLVTSNDGADCSLLVSPVNTKVCWPMLPLDELDVLELIPELELELELLGFNKAQGTATCLPAPLEVELLVPSVLPELDVPELEVPELLVPLLELPGEELAPEEPLEVPELLKERIAHSSLPEAGLMITSLIVPNESPEVDCTVEPVN